MTRTAVLVTAGVRKAERFPVSRKRKPGLPAHRPAGVNRLTVNEKEYADAVELAWNRIPSGVIEEQWMKPNGGDSLGGVVEAFLPYEQFLGELTLWQVDQSGAAMFNEIKREVAAQWKTFEKATPSQTALAMKFNRASPMATAYASLSAGNMVRDMIDSQVRSVRSVVTRAFNEGLTRQQTSRNLIQILNEIPTPKGAIAGNYAVGHMFGNATKGLTVRYADAVVNRASRLVRQNPDISPVDLKRKADQYGAKLRRSRARTIARTEMMRASNQGRLQGMWQAADQGLVNPTLAKKQWVTSSFDVCPICVPLNGVTVGIRDSFGPPGQAPPAHPNCRCVVRMLPDPMTFGLPTTTGTGQTGSPMQFVRPSKPGLKIEDLALSPGVVAQPGAVVGRPGARGALIGDDVVEPVGPRPPPSDASSRMVRRYDEDLDGPGEEVDLLEFFTGDNARDDRLEALLDADNWERHMNDVLFDDVFDAGKQIPQLQATLQQVKHLSYNDEAVTVYRAGAISAENVGAHSRFASTSRSRRTAQNFSDTRGYGDVVEYHLQPGDIAADLEKLGGTALEWQEAEVMVDGATLLRRIASSADDVAPSRVMPVAPEIIDSQATRAGNVSGGFDLPDTAQAKETVGVVLGAMDDAGYVVSQPLPTGNVKVKFLKKTPNHEEGGSFTAAGKIAKPRRPKANATPAQVEAYNEKARAWMDKGGIEPIIEVRTAKDVTVGSMQNVATHEIGHRLDKVVRNKQVTRARYVDGVREEFTETVPKLDGWHTEKTMKAAVDAVKDKASATGTPIANLATGNLRVDVGDVFQALKITDLKVADDVSAEMLAFMQAAGRSEALAELRNITSKIKGAAGYGRYVTSPKEIWARAFNQYFTMNNGSREAIEDMLEQISKPLWTDALGDTAATTEQVWYGFQWRQDEFEELIQPHVENVLRMMGVIE